MTLQFEALKVALKQDSTSYILTLRLHPDEIPEELLRDFVGARYMIAAVRVDEVSGSDQRVFPNPSQNILILQGWAGVNKPNIRFVNSFGQEISVDCDIIMDHLKMDISPLPPGTYFCIIESETGILSFKVIKI